MPITAFIGVRISWLMFARNIDFMAVASSAFSLAIRLRLNSSVRCAVHHCQDAFPADSVPSDPHFVGADHQAHKRQTHQAPEPPCRPPGRQHREGEGYTLLVPHPILAGCLDPEDVSSGRKAGIGGLAAPAIHLVPF